MKLKLLPWVSFHHDLHLMIFRPRGIVDEPHIEKTVAMLEQVEQTGRQTLRSIHWICRSSTRSICASNLSFASHSIVDSSTRNIRR